MSKFIISGFADEIADSLADQLSTLNELGIKYMEMRNVNGKGLIEHSLEEVKEIKKQLDEAGIKLSSLGSPIGKIKITDPFEEHFEKFKHIIECAKILEAPYIRMFSFFYEAGDDPEKYTDEVLRRWKCFEDYARGTGIILLHENEKQIYGDLDTRCKVILDACDKEVVRGVFDPANFVQCGVDTKKAFALLRDDIIYMHIKDALNEDGTVVPSGEGDGNVPYILSELAASGYEGFLSLEPHLLTGDIAVCGVPMFKRAHTALMDIISKLDVTVE